MTLGSPALRANPGLNDGIPMGFLLLREHQHEAFVVALGRPLPQIQRDFAPKPGVATQSLPWEYEFNFFNPNVGCVSIPRLHPPMIFFKRGPNSFANPAAAPCHNTGSLTVGSPPCIGGMGLYWIPS